MATEEGTDRDQFIELDSKLSYKEKMSQYFKNDKLSDVVLVVGDQRYPAHKTVLAMSSTYFERMFYGGAWKESNESDIKLVESQICADVFETFLRYFYTNSVSVTKHTIFPILGLADKYDVDGLKEICTSYISKVLYKNDIAAALLWLTSAERLGMSDLTNRLYDLLSFNFDEACKPNDWTSLSLKHVLTILKRSDLVVSNEYVVFQAVETWLQENVTTTEEFNQLVSHVQFKNMTVRQMCQVEKSALISQSDNPVTPYLLDAFRYVAVIQNYPEGDKEPAQFGRCYIDDTTTAKFALSSGYVSVTPSCAWSSEPAKFRWVFGKFDGSSKYQIRLSTTRDERERDFLGNYRTKTSYLYFTMPDTYKFKFNFIWRNEAGYVICATNGSFKTQIPRERGDRVRLFEFPEPSSLQSGGDSKSIAKDVRYSFVIEKV